MIVSRFLEANGLTTHLLEAGDARADTIVLLHDGDFGTTARTCWAPVIGALSREFHV